MSKKLFKANLRLVFSFIAVLLVAGCSSSNDDSQPLNDPGTGNPGTGNPGTGNPGTSDPGSTPTTSTLSLLQARDELLLALAGYSLEDQSEEVMLLGETLVAGASPGLTLDPGNFSVADRGETFASPTSRVRYDCPRGGSVIEEIGELRINESSYSNFADHSQYTFDQCHIETSNSQLVSGAVRVMTNSISGSRGGSNNKDVQWSNFSWQQGSNDMSEGSALIQIRRLESFDNSASRSVTINRFERKREGELLSRIEDSSMTVTEASEGSGAFQLFSLTTQGRVTNASGVAVQISTEQTMSARLAASPDFSSSAEAFVGVLKFRAEDGSELTLTAQPIVTVGPKLVDIFYVASDSTVTELMGQNFILPSAFAP